MRSEIFFFGFLCWFNGLAKALQRLSFGAAMHTTLFSILLLYWAFRLQLVITSNGSFDVAIDENRSNHSSHVPFKKTKPKFTIQKYIVKNILIGIINGMSSHEYIFKYIIIGDMGVGKSCLLVGVFLLVMIRRNLSRYIILLLSSTTIIITTITTAPIYGTKIPIRLSPYYRCRIRYPCY